MPTLTPVDFNPFPDDPVIPASASEPPSKPTSGRRQAAGPLSTSHAPVEAEAAAVTAPPSSPVVTAGENDDPSSRSGRSSESPRRKRRATASTNGGVLDEHDLNRDLAFLPLTDLGNAERFVARHRDVLRYVPNFGWFFWDGKRWARRGADEFVLRAEHETVRAIQDEADDIEGDDHEPIITKNPCKKNEEHVPLSDLLRGWGRASEASNRIFSIAKNARAYLSVDHSAFDSDPFRINLNNGTLVVRRPDQVAEGEPLIVIAPHDPLNLITKISPVDFDLAAQCPIFDRFFIRVQPAESQRRFIMAWHGYSLTGDAEEQKLAVYWGTGRNGKGTLVETCAFIAGDYAESVPVETFLASPVQRGGGQATPDLAKLPGVRFLRTGEPDKGAKLGEALIKRVTGGDPIDARNMFKEFFTFFAQFKLTIACNFKPTIAGTDEGIWGRMILVPWTVFIPKKDRDPFLKMKLRAEASGILNRLLDGLRDWLENGLMFGEDIEKATAQYRRESDAVGRFLEVCTASAPGERSQSSVLYELYGAWAKCNGAPNYSNKGFTGILADRGMQRIQNNNMFWVDLKMTKIKEDFVDRDGHPLTQSAESVADDGSVDLNF
jgi:putative DNA primase/helicase